MGKHKSVTQVFGVLALGALIFLIACSSSTEPKSGNCDPAYPTVCIPSPPPDLDCGEIPYRRFKVLRPDPHGFDRDRDGIGCESG